MPLVDVVARRVGRRVKGQVPFDDLVAMGRAALLDATRSFDPERARFRTYVGKKVAWAMYDGVRRETHGRRCAARAAQRAEPVDAHDDARAALAADRGIEERGEGAAVDDMESIEDQPSPDEDPEATVWRVQRAEALARAVRALPARERELVERHYFAGERFDLIALDLGISRSWASRLHAQAIRALAASAVREGLTDA